MDRLRQRADFLAVANGARVSSAAFSLQSRARSDQGPIRVGFTVDEEVGRGVIAVEARAAGEAAPMRCARARCAAAPSASVRGAMPAAVSPDRTGAFLDGVWHGSVAVSQPAAAVTLVADDSFGQTGASAPFDVARALAGRHRKGLSRLPSRRPRVRAVPRRQHGLERLA